MIKTKNLISVKSKSVDYELFFKNRDDLISSYLDDLDSIGIIKNDNDGENLLFDDNDAISYKDVLLTLEKYNAILITADKGMMGSARAKNLFIFEI
ncbi:MAG: hypothetical protein ACK4IX_11050 [Candidatus Sericytochromatia bacterium]